MLTPPAPHPGPVSAVAAALLLTVSAAAGGPLPGGLSHPRAHHGCTGHGLHGRAAHPGLGVRRHHGLGHAGFAPAGGVRRYHGLGNGNACDGRPHGTGVYPWLAARPPLIHRRTVPPIVAGPGPGGRHGRPGGAFVQGDPWSLLARGEAQAAHARFAVRCLRRPDDAEAKAGYALSAAMLGRDETALWAMRRAMEAGARDLGALALDEAAARRVGELMQRYGDREAAGAAFMRASLHYLLGCDDGALAAIREAAGGDEPWLRALREALKIRAGDGLDARPPAAASPPSGGASA